MYRAEVPYSSAVWSLRRQYGVVAFLRWLVVHADTLKRAVLLRNDTILLISMKTVTPASEKLVLLEASLISLTKQIETAVKESTFESCYR